MENAEAVIMRLVEILEILEEIKKLYKSDALDDTILLVRNRIMKGFGIIVNYSL